MCFRLLSWLVCSATEIDLRPLRAPSPALALCRLLFLHLSGLRSLLFWLRRGSIRAPALPFELLLQGAIAMLSCRVCHNSWVPCTSSWVWGIFVRAPALVPGLPTFLCRFVVSMIFIWGFCCRLSLTFHKGLNT